MTTRRNFEQARAWLSHDRLKGEFLLTMGYYPTDVGNEKRGEIMRSAVSRDPTNRERIKRGARVWEPMGPEIREFLATLPARYGFVLTNKYDTERQAAEAALAVIDQITRDITEGRLRESDIERFWNAADTVRQLLEDMAKSRRYPEFVLDIDPSLAKGHHIG